MTQQRTGRLSAPSPPSTTEQNATYPEFHVLACRDCRKPHKSSARIGDSESRIKTEIFQTQNRSINNTQSHTIYQCGETILFKDCIDWEMLSLNLARTGAFLMVVIFVFLSTLICPLSLQLFPSTYFPN
jgi:hypothetical protein